MVGDPGNDPEGGFSALLIGVPHYDSDDFPDIPTVRNDLTQLRLALESSGYDGAVRVVPEFPSDGSEPTVLSGSRISRLIREAFRSAPDGGVLFVYFTGHGVSRGGRDYLVPGDAGSLADVREDTQFLVPTDLSRYLEGCRARAVVFAVDACRDSLDPRKGVRLGADEGFGFGALDPTHRTRIGTVFGCDRGQYCYYSDELRMSLFTRALTTVLAKEHPARTLAEVVDGVNQVLQGLVQRYKPNRAQQVHTLDEGGADGIMGHIICLGGEDPLRTAIAGSSLWDRVRTDAGQEREVAVGTAVAVWNLWRDVVVDLPDDPWRDADHIIRCFAALDLLIPADAELAAAEVLVLLSGPLIAEATHLAGVRRLLPHDPRSLPHGVSNDPLRLELEAVHSAHLRVWQKAGSLAEQGAVTDADAIAVWLAHRCVFRQVDLWRQEPALRLSQRLAEAAEQRSGYRNELATAIRGVASMLAAGAEDLTVFLNGGAQGDRAGAAKDLKTQSGGRSVRLRSRALAILLGIAGTLALDSRRLGEVVVDHIGIHDPLDPATLRRAVQEARWSVTVDRSLSLQARCRHPAVHLALAEVTETVQQQLQAIRRCLGADGGDLLGQLPLSVGPADLSAEEDGEGRPVYETPLLQFRLAHHEIRDLLMGVRLYGDPSLAVRELYQNALDACRYRKLRAQYLGLTYAGRIRFRQDIDEDGREYIECVDNGVGMGRNELENTFSRAGRRFVNSTDFLWEQAEWLRKDESLRLWPNSRFGIGVFSYFMLADEIFVETARVDRRTNAPHEVLHVRISSSGSLFRITTAREGRESTDGLAAAGGTRVRLYLRSKRDEPISCVDTLDELVRWPEFEVVVGPDTAAKTWPAGKFRPASTYGWTLAAGKVWWVEKLGEFLVDGISTSAGTNCYVINFVGKKTPELSVDRKTVESWDRQWVREQLTAAAGRVAESGEITVSWISMLTWEQPFAAQAVLDLLVKGGREIRLGSGTWVSAAVDRVSLWNVTDSGYIQLRWSLWGTAPELIDAAVRSFWTKRGVLPTDLVDNGSLLRGSASRRVSVTCPPSSLAGHPFLQPQDIASVVPVDSSYLPDRIVAAIRQSRDSGFTMALLLHRSRRFVIYGASPPVAVDGFPQRVADERDLAVVRALSAVAPMVAFAEISHERSESLASILELANTFASLEGDAPFALSPEPGYVCRSGDEALIRTVLNGRSVENAVDWIHLFLSHDRRTADAMTLLQKLNLPAQLLLQLADAARSNGPLACQLSWRADPALSWIHGKLTLLDLLIAAAACEQSVPEVAASLTAWAPVLGFELPDETPAASIQPVPAADLPLLRAADIARTRVDKFHYDGLAVLADICHRCRMSPGEVMDRLARYRCWIDLPLPTSADSLPDRAPDDDDVRLWGRLEVKSRTFDDQLITMADEMVLADVPRVRDWVRTWRHPFVAGKSWALCAKEVREASLDPRELVVLSRDLDGDRPFVVGTMTPLHVVGAADRNRETVGETLARVAALAERFPVSAPDFDWGEMAEVRLPPEDYRAGFSLNDSLTIGCILICTAHRSEQPLSEVVARFTPLLTMHGRQPLSAHETAALGECPDNLDVMLVLPLVGKIDDDYRWDALHVVRIAAYLGVPLGEVGKRLGRFAPLLVGSVPDVPEAVAGLVPDWRDPVLLTPGLDGKRLLADGEIDEAFVARAAREVEIGVVEVRERLARFTEWCGLTPGVV